MYEITYRPRISVYKILRISDKAEHVNSYFTKTSAEKAAESMMKGHIKFVDSATYESKDVYLDWKRRS